MSTNVDQSRTSSSKAPSNVSSESSKDTDMNYVTTQRDGYALGDGSLLGTSDQYSIMSGYYPYYAAADDMNAGRMWSTGDVVSPAAMSYGYNPLDYAPMMTNYGYSPFGWFPGSGGSGWETGLGAMKNDPAASYAAMGGYYGMEAVGSYSSTGLLNGQQDRDVSMSSVEQGMQSLNVNEGRRADSNTSKDTSVTMATTANGVTTGSKSWASVASQPSHSYLAKSRGAAQSRVPMAPGSAWDGRSAGEAGRQAHDGWSASRRRPTPSNTGTGCPPTTHSADNKSTSIETNQYNPKEFDLNPKSARFFIIKSYAEDDIHRSIKYSIWCSTEYGNKRLDAAYREREGKGPIYLFYSVNGSGHFCGIAQMTSAVDYDSSARVWQQDNKWKGQFTVKWVYVKDVPNSQLRHIRLENNEGKPVTNSRDTQEVPADKGCQVLRVIHQYRHTTSIFDDFSHYENHQTNKNDDE